MDGPDVFSDELTLIVIERGLRFTLASGQIESLTAEQTASINKGEETDELSPILGLLSQELMQISKNLIKDKSKPIGFFIHLMLYLGGNRALIYVIFFVVSIGPS